MDSFQMSDETSATHESSTPLVTFVVNELHKILGALPVNGRCPLEQEIAKKFSVSRTTVRKAYDVLEQNGVIRREGSLRYLANEVNPDTIADQPFPVSKEKEVSQYIIGLISEGKITQGQRISERQIASTLGCSMSPVREALISLARLGILEKKDRKQWQAATPDDRLLEELTEFRRIIERYCLESLMRDGNLEQYLPTFQSLLKRTKDFLQNENTSTNDLFEADIALHQSLLESRKNQLLLERSELIYALIEFQLRSKYFTADRGRLGLTQHISILEAIIRNDVDTALRELDNHLFAALETLKSIGEAVRG